MDLEEAMTTQRAIRKLKPDPVDDDIILKCLRLAVKAPTGSNAQGWEWIVVRDPEVKKALGRQNRLAWKRFARAAYSRDAKSESHQKVLRAVDWQADHWDEIPVVIIACLRGFSLPLPGLYSSSRYGSIYPAVQNLLLALRAEGVGAALTTIPVWSHLATRRILHLPVSVEPVCAIPIGWPMGRYGPTTRKPVEELTHLDRWGNLAFASISDGG